MHPDDALLNTIMKKVSSKKQDAAAAAEDADGLFDLNIFTYISI